MSVSLRKMLSDREGVTYWFLAKNIFVNWDNPSKLGGRVDNLFPSILYAHFSVSKSAEREREREREREKMRTLIL